MTILESIADFVKIKSFSSLKSDDFCFLRIWEDVAINLNYTHISFWLFFGMFSIPSWILKSKVSAANLKIIARSRNLFIKWTNFILLNSVYLLVVHWLGLHAFNAGALASILGQGTRSHMPQLRVHMPHLKIPCFATKTWHSQINKYKKRVSPVTASWGLLRFKNLKIGMMYIHSLFKTVKTFMHASYDGCDLVYI